MSPEPVAEDDGQASAEPLTKDDFVALAQFRSAIRRSLRRSEEIVRRHAVTPQQYHLLLAVKGFPGRERASIGELADLLQLRHHSLVELVTRAQAQELVSRNEHPEDGRVVRVTLTAKGDEVLGRLAALHRDELRRMESALGPPTGHGAG